MEPGAQLVGAGRCLRRTESPQLRTAAAPASSALPLRKRSPGGRRRVLPAAPGELRMATGPGELRTAAARASSILEKSDYTTISGNPYIKKSGWRKISCFFNISFEIKDRSIEFDEDHNVKRAEFLVRASMLGGRFSDGWGSCDRREKRFNKPNHDIPSTAETRAKNKACQDLLGIGNNRPG